MYPDNYPMMNEVLDRGRNEKVAKVTRKEYSQLREELGRYEIEYGPFDAEQLIKSSSDVEWAEIRVEVISDVDGVDSGP